MSESAFPLQVIRQAEMDLRQRVEDARRQAEARIQAARIAAGQVVALADQEGQAEAQACYQQGIAQAQQEAEAIITTARTEAAAMRQKAMIRLEVVAGWVVELVLPPDLVLGPPVGAENYAPLHGEGADHRHEAVPG